ncbi:MAG: glycosyltransferase family 9 protein [Verrucomicrobiae bacterium]|nr:glycosyltransferase family 9 protein [Verrucomicrobiae bacterium]
MNPIDFNRTRAPSLTARVALDLAYGRPRSASPAFRPENVRRILVIRRNGIGDMICTLPLLRSLAEARPDLALDVLAGEKNALLLEGLPFIRKVHVYRRGRGLMRNHYLNLRRVLAPIRAENYDLVIAVKAGFSPLLAVIARATRAPWRLGYVPSKGHPLGFCFNLQVELPVEREHQMDSCLRFLDPLGISVRSRDLSFLLPPEARRWAEAAETSHGLAGRPWALVHVSSERHESRWTPVGMASLAAALKSSLGFEVLLCGLPSDAAAMAMTAKLAGAAVVGRETPPSIRHFAALAARARFLVCSDGGQMHVGAAMRTPVFALFSTADPRIWRAREVPFSYIQRGHYVADLAPAEVAAQVVAWAKNLPP